MADKLTREQVFKLIDLYEANGFTQYFIFLRLRFSSFSISSSTFKHIKEVTATPATCENIFKMNCLSVDRTLIGQLDSI